MEWKWKLSKTALSPDQIFAHPNVTGVSPSNSLALLLRSMANASRMEEPDGGTPLIPMNCPTWTWSAGRDVVDGRSKGRFIMRSIPVIEEGREV